MNRRDFVKKTMAADGVLFSNAYVTTSICCTRRSTLRQTLEQNDAGNDAQSF